MKVNIIVKSKEDGSELFKYSTHNKTIIDFFKDRSDKDNNIKIVTLYLLRRELEKKGDLSYIPINRIINDIKELESESDYIIHYSYSCVIKKKSKTVKSPDLKIFGENDGKSNPLINFYKALGYDPEKTWLDPSKIIMNVEDQTKAIKLYRQGFKDEDQMSAMFSFISSGPAGDEGVKEGYIRLEDGWLTLDESSESKEEIS